MSAEQSRALLCVAVKALPVIKRTSNKHSLFEILG